MQDLVIFFCIYVHLSVLWYDKIMDERQTPSAWVVESAHDVQERGADPFHGTVVQPRTPTSNGTPASKVPRVKASEKYRFLLELVA